MTDDEIIILAESLGFRFHKLKNQWKWSVVAPDESSFSCEQGEPQGMTWLREKLTHFLPKPLQPQGTNMRKVSNLPMACFPELLDPEILRAIFSLYLQGVAVEDIQSAMLFHPNSAEGGPWNGFTPSTNLVNAAIDHCLAFSAIR